MEIFSINKRETSTHLSKKMYINDMCELFGVSSSTISRWVKRKRIPSSKRDKNGKRFWLEAEAE